MSLKLNAYELLKTTNGNLKNYTDLSIWNKGFYFFEEASWKYACCSWNKNPSILIAIWNIDYRNLLIQDDEQIVFNPWPFSDFYSSVRLHQLQRVYLSDSIEPCTKSIEGNLSLNKKVKKFSVDSCWQIDKNNDVCFK